jgi:peptide/nickel transport system substrate-binding protein
MMRPPGRVRTAALVLCLLSAVVSACGSPKDSAAPDGGGAPQPGGTLTYLLSGEALSLDPVTFSVPSNPSLLAPRALAVFDALAIDDPATGELRMRLAESMTTTDDLTWTIKLRAGVTFSDGTPFDAAAVQFNWERIADPANRAPMAAYAQKIATMEVADATTLKVRLKEANASFPRTIGRYLTYIGSPTAIRADPAGFATKPVGAGPYVVTQFVRDDHLTLDRNRRYQGTTYLDRIVIRTVVDDTQRLNALTSGQADAMFSSDPATAAKGEDAGFGHVETSLNGGSDIMFNVSRAPFDDVRARQAIALAFDREALNRDLYDGRSKIVDTLFVPNSPFFDQTVRQETPNQEKAQQLFDTLAQEGKPLRVTFLVPQSFATRAEWFQAQLRKYRNVTAELRVIPDAQTSGIASAGEFDAAFLTTSWLYPDPSLSAFFGTGGTQNWGRYSNAGVDAALAEARHTQDEAVRRAAYEKVQQSIIRDIPATFYFRPTYLVIQRPEVHGLTTMGDGSPVWTDIWTTRG